MFIWAVGLAVAMYVTMKVIDKTAKGWEVDTALRWRTRSFITFVVTVLGAALVGIGSLIGLAF